MQTAARNRSGYRQTSASALNAPIEAPATITEFGPPVSAWMAGTTSWAIGLLELVEQPAAVGRVAVVGGHRLPGHGVAGVDLDPAVLDEPGEVADEVVSLDLLGVTAGRREDQHRDAEVAPAGQRDVLLHPVGPPALDHLVHVNPSWGCPHS